jgi:uncharacterized YigZ family protein
MPDPARYPVPAATHRVEEQVRRSRFITTLGRASSPEEAAAFVRVIAEEFPDATHHCWAYVIGPPGSTGRVGMSDAGEPHGTAGRPIFSALLHGGVGDIVAVVTRYYGGTKLGTGGLVRAYGGGVQRALASLARAERVEMVSLRLTVGYGRAPGVRQILPEFEAGIVDERDEAEVTLRVRLPRDRVDRFRSAVMDATRGEARMEIDLRGSGPA